MQEGDLHPRPSRGGTVECTYCEKAATTDDHLPPRCIFAAPLPNDLITVPACESCNNGASKDDEYFRSRIVLRADVANEVSAQKALESVMRSLKRPSARGFQVSLARDVRLVDLVTPAGIFVSQAPAMVVDPRQSRVPRRIAQGLLLHHTGRKLPDGYGVRAFPLDQIEYVDDKRREALAKFLAPVVESGTRHEVGGVFSYWFATAADDSAGSVWVFVFYGKAVFVALTGPEKSLNAIELEPGIDRE